MSLVTDTVARILANVDGETKAESVSAEESAEVYRLVADNLRSRHEALLPHVESLRQAREDASRSDFDADVASEEGMPVSGPRPTTMTGTPETGNDVNSGPHGDPNVPVNALPENTPAQTTDRAPISAAGSEGANDL